MPEPKRPPSLTKLIDTLARLFVDIDSSRPMVDRAQMDATVIAFDARALFNWTAIVGEAIRQNRMKELVTAASELYPEVPELPHGLRDYERWVAQHGSAEVVEKIAEQPPPRLWERSWRGALGWTIVAFACFAVISIVARKSQHLFYGLLSTDVLRNPEEWLADGLEFLGRTLMVAVEYTALNPLGVLAILVGYGLAIYLLVRYREPLAVVFRPRIMVPLLIIAALAKTFWYDMPTLKLDNVLRVRSVDMTSFEIPPMFAPRAKAVWQGVACSRIAGFDSEEVRRICGDAPARRWVQKLYGRFLLALFFTIALCSFGVRVIRKLLLPSRDAAWNVPPLWKRVLVAGSSIALLIAILGVPWTYSRTVRRMTAPKVCTDDPEEPCYYRICVDQGECYAYWLPDEIEPETARPANAQIKDEEDLLQVAFGEQLGAVIVNPLDRARRFP